MGDSVRDLDIPAVRPIADLKTTTIDDDLGLRKVGRANLPTKPRRYFLPGLVVCIITRLEMFHRVSLDLQCSKPGIEVRQLISRHRVPSNFGLLLVIFASSGPSP